MKKHTILLFTFLGLFLFSTPVHAFKHGYTINTDKIYAMVRHDLAVYSSPGGDFLTYLPSFSGVTVIGSTSSWYEIRYNHSSGTRYGWATKEDFTYDCLIYDGRKKQPLADGVYRFRYVTVTAPSADKQAQLFPVSKRQFHGSYFTCRITSPTDEGFQICKTDTGEYLLSDRLFSKNSSGDIWGTAAQAGTFRFVRKGNYYGIQDTVTNRFFGKSKEGLFTFTSNKDTSWRLHRTQKAIGKSNLRVFVQFDPEWAGTYYGKGKNPDPSTNNFCTSGCGIFATMNAIYSLTGHYANPHLLADYAVDHYFRIQGHGTDSGFFKAAAMKFGYKYGFQYDGSGDTLRQLKEKLKKGDTAITYVPGHYTTIVDYNEKTKKFLLLDPHYLPKRKTSSFGDWVSEKEISEGSLYAQMFFYYKPMED